MARFVHNRIQGTLWGRGIGGILAGAVVLIVLLVFVPAVRGFAVISLLVAIPAVGVLYLYNKYVPVRDPEDKKVTLHLTDEPAPRTPPSDEGKTQPR